MKRIVVIYCCALLFPIMAFAQQEYEDTCSVRYDLNAMFASLDKTKIPTGFLIDYSVNLIDLDAYDGVSINDDNYVSYETFEYIYRAVRSSSVTQTLIPAVSTINSDLDELYSEDTNPVAIALYRYNYIRADALTGGYISYVDGVVSDVYNEGIWRNPYADTCVVAFSPLVNTWDGLVFDYFFDSDCILTNETISSIEFDSGDGTGYHSLSIPQSISASYSCPGDYELKLRITLNGGHVLMAHSPILVSLPRIHHPIIRPRVRPDPKQPDTLFTAMGFADTVSAYVSTNYIDSSYQHLTNPIIVAEGFDIVLPGYHYLGTNNIRDITDALATQSLRAGHDIVYVDWLNHDADIRLNAELLKQIIRWVNAKKEGNNPNIVFGQSMGGLIARYALCSMESSGENHQVSSFVSHDSPHLGANIPIGLQKAISYLLTQVDMQNLPPLLRLLGYYYDVEEYLSIISKIQNSKSIPQMLLWANPNLFTNASYGPSWRTIINQSGYPHGPLTNPLINLAISNGGNDNHALPNEIFTFDATAYIGAALRLILLLYSVPSGELYSILKKPGTTRYNLSIHAYKALSPSNPFFDITLFYSKKFLWIFEYQKECSHVSLYGTEGSNMDSYKGSYFENPNLNINKIFTPDTILVSSYSAHIFAEPSFMFVPNFSSLDAGVINATLDFWNPTIDKLKLTPFDGYYMVSTPTSHIHLTSDMCSWMLDQVGIRIAGPDNPVTGTQLSLTGGNTSSVVWSSSNPSRASISTNGTITRHGFSPFTIMVEGMINGSPFRRTRFFEGALPGYVLHDSYNMITEKTTVTASLEDEDEAALLQGQTVHYYWGRVTSFSGGNISWTESNSLTYRFYLGAGNHTTVYFKVQMNNVEWVYSIRCYALEFMEPPLGLIEITPDGMMLAEDGDGESVTVEVKSDMGTEKRVIVYSFGELGTFQADHILSSAEMCQLLLKNAIFVSRVKTMRPWGEEEILVLPYSVYDEESATTVESMLQFVYSETP